MEKRLITAIALSILIIVAFQYVAGKPPSSQNAPALKEAMAPKEVEIVSVAEPKNLPEEKETEAILQHLEKQNDLILQILNKLESK